MLVFIVGIWFAAPRIKFHVWYGGEDESGHEIVYVQMRNVGAAGVTADLGEVFTMSAHPRNPRLDYKTHEEVKWIGPELPYRLTGRSGPARWHAVCKKPLYPHTVSTGSAVMVVTHHRKPRALPVGNKPPKEWKITSNF